MNFVRAERIGQTREGTGFDSYGRIFHDAFELVSERDFGCGVSVIGGVPSLKKAGPDPVGEIVLLSPAEPNPVHSNYKERIT